MEYREARNRASEIKFVVTEPDGQRICDWARTHLQPDPYGQGAHGDAYQTSSLYFDTETLDVFNRRGSYGRAKYRIRRYANADDVFLERKLRRPRMLVKRRTRAPMGVLSRLEAGDLSEPWEGSWFGARLAARRLAPVCQISYRRIARGTQVDGVPLRLTLDDQIEARPVTSMHFAAGAGERILPHHMILELKFRGTVPALFKHLVEEFGLNAQKASKYRLAMTTLGCAAGAINGHDLINHLEIED